MKMVKRATVVLLATLLLTSLTVPCSAAENTFRDVFENALYGGLVGALVGGACLAFVHKPVDHLDYLSVGAATGILAGVGYTAAKNSRSLLAFEAGNVKFAVPTVTPELQQANGKGPFALMVKADLISGKF